MTKPISRLFCFDFDNTLVDGHFHNALFNLSVPSGKATAEQIASLLNSHGIFNAELLLTTFRAILSNGHHIAITTWSEYPEVIVPTLQKLGLNSEEIAQIHVESGIPPSQEAGKSGHIARAKQHFGITDNKNVFLIDDDEDNILQARKEGQTGFHAVSPKTNTDYLQNILTLLDKPAPRRSVRIASLNTIEGQRLFEVHKDLQAKGKRRQGIRKDGEKPLGRFLAKNPAIAAEIGITTPAPVDVTKTDATLKDQDQPKNTSENPLDAKILTAAKAVDFKARMKTLIVALLLALSVAAILYSAAASVSLTIMLSALAFTVVAGISEVQDGLFNHASIEARKDKHKWMTENKDAYELGCDSAKAWVPYLKSYVQPNAYTSAYQIGFRFTSVADKVLGKEIAEIVTKYTPKG